jgi:dipeptidyl aminopeptidase/acylaminoacyl peptidase
MRPVTVLVAAALLVPARPGPPQPVERRDGAVVEQAPCPAYVPPSYEDYAATAKKFYEGELSAATAEGIAMRTPLALATREEHARNVETSRRVRCTRLVYMSDGLKVAGLMWRPSDRGPAPLPLIIFNRGGNRDFAQVPPWHAFHRFAAEGFVVLASQYRGVDGGEGIEEFGGADVHDITNLVPLARGLGGIDLDNIFMLGWSRGAMSTFLALKQGMKVSAVAVGGGLLDLVAEARRRPAVAARVWGELMPGYASRRDEVLRERSVMYWPERITAPVLILHGGGDWRASPAEALTLAQKLQAAGKPYELIVYANDDHAVSGNAADRNRRIVLWFRKHMR